MPPATLAPTFSEEVFSLNTFSQREISQNIVFYIRFTPKSIIYSEVSFVWGLKVQGYGYFQLQVFAKSVLVLELHQKNTSGPHYGSISRQNIYIKRKAKFLANSFVRFRAYFYGVRENKVKKTTGRNLNLNQALLFYSLNLAAFFFAIF